MCLCARGHQFVPTPEWGLHMKRIVLLCSLNNKGYNKGSPCITAYYKGVIYSLSNVFLPPNQSRYVGCGDMSTERKVS